MPLLGRDEAAHAERIAKRIAKEEIGKLDLKKPVKVDAKELVSLVLKDAGFIKAIEKMVDDKLPKDEPDVKKTTKK